MVETGYRDRKEYVFNVAKHEKQPEFNKKSQLLRFLTRIIYIKGDAMSKSLETSI